MPHEQNLFISYAHIDDQPLTPGEQGWISRFHATLDALLSMRLGRKATIWRDQKLQGNDVFSDEIVAQFSRSAVFVPILSARYLDSAWCTREIREFCENAQRHGGVIVGNKSRVFKVIKTPVDAEAALPAAMQDVLGYEFFALRDGAPLELDPAYGLEYAQLYNQKVAKLAWDVAQLLKSLEATGGPRGSGDTGTSETAAMLSKPVVYLAECGFDRRTAREQVDGELRRLGYTVLPEQRLPADEADYASAVASLLARCALSVHLVGDAGGAVLDGPGFKSTTALQNELAVSRCRDEALARLIWLPEGTRSEQPTHQAFIEALHQDAAAQFGADLITGDLAELRAAVHTTLKRLERPPARAPERSAADAAETALVPAKLIYLLCDEQDRKATIPLRKWCRQAGFEVALPVFAGDAAQVREAHQQLLTACDATLVFYGAGDEGWKRAIDIELAKAAAYRAGRPLLVRYVYLAEPTTGDKDDLVDMEAPGLVDGRGGFDAEALSGLAHALGAAGAHT